MTGGAVSARTVTFPEATVRTFPKPSVRSASKETTEPAADVGVMTTAWVREALAG